MQLIHIKHISPTAYSQCGILLVWGAWTNGTLTTLATVWVLMPRSKLQTSSTLALWKMSQTTNWSGRDAPSRRGFGWSINPKNLLETETSVTSAIWYIQNENNYQRKCNILNNKVSSLQASSDYSRRPIKQLHNHYISRAKQYTVFNISGITTSKVTGGTLYPGTPTSSHLPVYTALVRTKLGFCYLKKNRKRKWKHNQ